MKVFPWKTTRNPYSHKSFSLPFLALLLLLALFHSHRHLNRPFVSTVLLNASYLHCIVILHVNTSEVYLGSSFQWWLPGWLAFPKKPAAEQLVVSKPNMSTTNPIIITSSEWAMAWQWHYCVCVSLPPISFRLDTRQYFNKFTTHNAKCAAAPQRRIFIDLSGSVSHRSLLRQSLSYDIYLFTEEEDSVLAYDRQPTKYT